ncbi:MAG: hypothetical protein Q4G34_10365 [Micrococcus sp.]|nr:hypothetical protein [Micrococcus sp.]
MLRAARRVRIALSIPLALTVLVIALGAFSVFVPLGLLYGLWGVSLVAPVAGLFGIHASSALHLTRGVAALILGCVAVRALLHFAHVIDPGSSYVAPLDLVISFVLFRVGVRLVRRAEVQEVLEGSAAGETP